MPFGVTMPNVMPIKTCLVLSQILIGFTTLAKFCHFKISKNLFEKVSSKSIATKIHAFGFCKVYEIISQLKSLSVS